MSRYKVSDDGLTVVDTTTGLMWQQAGSENPLTYKDTKIYVETLNQGSFAGYSDWRLPTRDELYTLLTEEQQDRGLFISPSFDPTQSWCWSATKGSSAAAWRVRFDFGGVGRGGLDFVYYVRCVRS